jgi:hypothetical protein
MPSGKHSSIVNVSLIIRVPILTEKSNTNQAITEQIQIKTPDITIPFQETGGKDQRILTLTESHSVHSTPFHLSLI